MPPSSEEIKLLELAARHAIAEEGRDTQRLSGRLSAWERIDVLLDKNTFEETDKFVTHHATDFGMTSHRPPGDGVITGYGRVHGRVVCVFAQDFTVFGGSISEANAAKIVKLIDTAMSVGAPLIGLHESGGVRIEEGIVALAGYGDIFLRSALASGVIPQISAIFGSCIGTDAYLSALTDFTLMARDTDSPAAHIGEDDRHTLATIRELLSRLPSNNGDTSSDKPTTDDPDREDLSLDTLIPVGDQPYDMLDIIARIVDQDETGKGYLFQTREHFARNILIGFARMHGRTVGVVANQPAVLAGVLDDDACVKAARFVRFCDAFHIPLITFADTPGFLSTLQPQHAAQLLYAFAEATVPKLAVVTRRAYGAGYCAMSSKHLRADLNLAWPTAEITVAGPETAVNILYKSELESIVRRVQATMPQGVALSEEQKLGILAEARKERIDEYRERFANPYVAAERGYIDAVIRPSETRRRLNASLDILSAKRGLHPSRKHGNIPL